MNFKNKAIPITIILTLTLTNLLGQYNSWDGSHEYLMDPHNEYRSMNIFVNIVYDNPNDTVEDPFPGNNYPWPQATTEGINQNLPDYFHDLFDTVYSENPNGTFTRIYAESSFNDLFILGDYMVVNINRSRLNNGNPFNLMYMPNEIFGFINSIGGYDAILNNDESQDYDADNNNKVDVCNIYVRNCNPPYGEELGRGLVSEQANISLLMQDGYTTVERLAISSVGPKSSWTQNPTSIVFHEFSHLLFGGNNKQTVKFSIVK